MLCATLSYFRGHKFWTSDLNVDASQITRLRQHSSAVRNMDGRLFDDQTFVPDFPVREFSSLYTSSDFAPHGPEGLLPCH